MVLDGEVVALDEQGRPSFERLQSRMHLASDSAVRRRMKDLPVTYVIFDLLYLDGHSTMSLSYEERRDLLARLELEGPVVAHARLSPGRGRRPARGHRGRWAWRAWWPSGSTPPTSPAGAPGLDQGQERDTTQDVVIGGWTPGEGGRGGQPRRARGRRHGGRRAALRRQGRHRLHRADAGARCSASSSRCRRDDSPFSGRQPPRGTVFVEPRARGRGGVPRVDEERHPARALLQGAPRPDKDPQDCIREEG